MPCSGPRCGPPRSRPRPRRACRRARSNVGVMKARVWASYCSTRWISASTSSTGDSFRAAIRRDELGDREVVEVGGHRELPFPRTRASVNRVGDLHHHGFGFLPELLVAVVRDRVVDHDERIVGQAVQLGDGAGARHEAVGHDGDGGDAPPLRGDGVVHTARRAAPSVADAGDDRVGGAQLARGARSGAGRLESGLRRRMTSRTP